MDKHLLIDGYNMIHGIPTLSRVLEESPDAACDSLVQMARTIHDEDGLRVTVVFDGREKRIQVENPCNRPTFSVIYAPRQLSADGVIEQLLAKTRVPESVTVASRDNMIREAAAARGSFSIDGRGFEDWVGRCERRTSSRLGAGKTPKWKSSLGDQWKMPRVPEESS
ncbi:NYN domain-containing protein [Puniceicoccus vermicola]|uniref:NYN domain-containing protein n=1 Tax=Puniceicoccus vermicola TaxID=388746 RepID=A0A7X1AWZ4_9BACT|nr:NYN domain-containing protein [Puniceicoccus vermicola]MBC2601452.1 NYN domain-containing protein [Puniceicoccus vermicola]